MPNNVIDFPMLKCFPTSERKYILAMFWCTMQEDKNISVISYNTLYFLQLQIEVHIEQSVCQHPNYSDAQLNASFLLQIHVVATLCSQCNHGLKYVVAVAGESVAEVRRKLFTIIVTNIFVQNLHDRHLFYFYNQSYSYFIQLILIAMDIL